MEEYECISIAKIFEKMKEHMILIILLMVVGGMVGGCYAVQTRDGIYECSGKLIISKESAKIFYEDSYTQSDITMYEKIVNTYVEIAKSNTVLNEVVKAVPEYSAKQIANMIKVSSISNTLILKVTLTTKNQADAYILTNTYLSAIINQCNKILPVGDLSILDEAVFPNETVDIGLSKFCTLGAVAGVVAACGVIFLKMFLASTRISTKKQVEEYLGMQAHGLVL